MTEEDRDKLLGQLAVETLLMKAELRLLNKNEVTVGTKLQALVAADTDLGTTVTQSITDDQAADKAITAAITDIETLLANANASDDATLDTVTDDIGTKIAALKQLHDASTTRTAALLAALQAPAPTPPVVVTSLVPAATTGAVGDTIATTFTAADGSAAASFTSSDPTVATVDASGVVTLVGAGTVTISVVSVSSVTASCGISVTPA